MRITRDVLMKIVRDTVQQRTRTDRSLLSIYLCGSLLKEDPMLGGTTDIDLVFIHTDEVNQPREIVPLTEDVHLDIAHHFHRDYRQTRSLRVHPWLGPTLKDCSILFDPQHFMDFTQASVRGQFDRSDHVMERAHRQAEHARQIWQGLHLHGEPGPQGLADYVRALDHAVNSVAVLTGPPLTERRFLLDFPKRAQEVKRPGLHAGLLGLLGAPQATPAEIQAWLPGWEAAYQAHSLKTGFSRLHPARRRYYLRAIEAMLKGEQPPAALWPLVRTWVHAIQDLPGDSPECQPWNTAMTQLGLVGEGFSTRIEALDSFLDLVDDTLDAWAKANGAEIS